MKLIAPCSAVPTSPMICCATCLAFSLSIPPADAIVNFLLVRCGSYASNNGAPAFLGANPSRTIAHSAVLALGGRDRPLSAPRPVLRAPSPQDRAATTPARARTTRANAEVSSRTSPSEGITPLRYAIPIALRTPRSPATTRGRPIVRAKIHSAVHTPIPRSATSSSITAASESAASRSRFIWSRAIAWATAMMYSALRLVNCSARISAGAAPARRSALRL